MDKDIEIIVGDFVQAINTMNKAIESISKSQKNLNTTNETLKSCWKGDAKDKYYTQYKKIADKFQDYNSCLSSMSEDLVAILEGMANTDSEIKNQINAIKS